MKSVVRYLRDWSGCRCVGIRLADRERRLPLVACVGYSRAFRTSENCLSLETADCPCNRIFRGEALASDAPFTSQKGSFFCNQASRLAEHFGTDPHKRSRLTCLHASYESLAHVPIFHQGRLFGTIQLADPRANRVPLESVSFIETVAPLIGEALHRFQVEESLVESEQRFRAMFERHDAAMLLVEPDSGAIQDANAAAAAFYGHSRERLRTMNIQSLTVLPSQTAEEWRRRARQEGRKYIAVPHRLAGGEIRTVEVHSSPVQVRDRRLLFVILHDVTERKLLEQQLLNVGEAERQRIGRDLHDSLGGTLTGAALLSKALTHQLAAKAAAEAAVAEDILRCINDAIGQARAVARGLLPIELSAGGLVAGLREFAAEITRRSGIPCRLRAARGALISDTSVALHLFRIVQEAVSNALRHGGARQIEIRLAKTSGQIRLEVRDDGKGLPARRRGANGLGLRTMKYRADAIGAQLTVESANGRGTLVSCLLPVSRPPLPGSN